MKTLNDREFEQKVRRAAKPAVVCFTAPWCGTCYPTCLVTDELAAQYADTFEFFRVDIDQTGGKLARDHHIIAVPSILIFQDGREVRRLVGFQDRSELRDILSAWQKTGGASSPKEEHGKASLV